MRRAVALGKIVAEVARNGETTSFALRLYMENRISYGSYKKAVVKGKLIFNSGGQSLIQENQND